MTVYKGQLFFFIVDDREAYTASFLPSTVQLYLTLVTTQLK